MLNIFDHIFLIFATSMDFLPVFPKRMLQQAVTLTDILWRKNRATVGVKHFFHYKFDLPGLRAGPSSGFKGPF